MDNAFYQKSKTLYVSDAAREIPTGVRANFFKCRVLFREIDNDLLGVEQIFGT